MFERRPGDTTTAIGIFKGIQHGDQMNALANVGNNFLDFRQRLTSPGCLSSSKDLKTQTKGHLTGIDDVDLFANSLCQPIRAVLYMLLNVLET